MIDRNSRGFQGRERRTIDGLIQVHRLRIAQHECKLRPRRTELNGRARRKQRFSNSLAVYECAVSAVQILNLIGSVLVQYLDVMRRDSGQVIDNDIVVRSSTDARYIGPEHATGTCLPSGFPNQPRVEYSMLAHTSSGDAPLSMRIQYFAGQLAPAHELAKLVRWKFDLTIHPK